MTKSDVDSSCFDDWTQQELAALFCTGCITNLMEKRKLSISAIFAYPAIPASTMRIYEELIETGYYPSPEDIACFLTYIRIVSGRDVQQQDELQLH